ncbi:MAG TPA: carbohydrate ABC transporter permease [Candidatus Eisenbergiella merdigallinarum]|uniref:Carbohydrate ABC transporter permease n=1 Tax=Candidatus Eisenbergiella merdigallinarum TaxID=2838552 RepID=A0A9D2MR09_9FIRM|nr:carbohydrate ABC transporter permease [Candidatus Eisenbergiella merdigallinarum]
MKKSKGDRALTLACDLILILVAVVIILPILNLVAVSVSEQTPVISGKVKFWPMGFQLDAYRYVMGSRQFFSSLSVSLFVTLAGSALAVICSVLVAYPLSKQNLPARKALLLAFLFTMMFNGGIIPSYLLIMRLNLINSVWSLILPQLVNVYNLLIVKNYMEALPESLVEAAKIDGASQMRILRSVVLPMAKPVLATVFMFFVVTYWNSYFDAKMYITERELMPIQQYLQTVIFEAQSPAGDYALGPAESVNAASKSIVNATVVCAMIPMVILYPTLQRFFAKGATAGAVKG